jgi:hypothetical protein
MTQENTHDGGPEKSGSFPSFCKDMAEKMAGCAPMMEKMMAHCGPMMERMMASCAPETDGDAPRGESG